MNAGSPNGPKDSDDDMMAPTASSKEDMRIEDREFRTARMAFRIRARRYRRPFSSWLMNDLVKSFGQFKGFIYESQDI